MQIRLAERKDIDRLIRMRWDFTLEDYKEALFQKKIIRNSRKNADSFWRKLLREAFGISGSLKIMERLYHICT
ncbi:hypothetical protein [Bacillus infantis]|uniref:hypothetical protein n=1 Tax=Bacillus infantis TaxID=324767 RepID=UPI003CF7ABE8